jgi:hypothetical protein
MTENNVNSLAEARAVLALSELKKRERLLKVVRGKPAWIYLVCGIIWFVIVLFIYHTGNADSRALLCVLIPLGFAAVGAYVDTSRRMNAILELLGEEDLGQRSQLLKPEKK